MNRSSADEEDILQLGKSSVNSDLMPRSMSKKSYSQVDVGEEPMLIGEIGVTVVPELGYGCVENVPLTFVVVVADVVDCGVEEEHVSGDVDEGGDDDGVDIEVAAGIVEKRSLLFNGSRADCDDKLNTELQFIVRLLSSSP